MVFQDVTYNIPVIIWLMESHTPVAHSLVVFSLIDKPRRFFSLLIHLRYSTYSMMQRFHWMMSSTIFDGVKSLFVYDIVERLLIILYGCSGAIDTAILVFSTRNALWRFIQLFYGLLGSWTAYLISILYVEYRTRKEREKIDLCNHVIQADTCLMSSTCTRGISYRG